jgi:hypothetical protein
LSYFVLSALLFLKSPISGLTGVHAKADVSGVSGSATFSWYLSWFCRFSLLLHELVSQAKSLQHGMFPGFSGFLCFFALPFYPTSLLPRRKTRRQQAPLHFYRQCRLAHATPGTSASNCCTPRSINPRQPLLYRNRLIISQNERNRIKGTLASPEQTGTLLTSRKVIVKKRDSDHIPQKNSSNSII